MKYLIISKPGTNLIPREQGAALLRAGTEWIKAKLSDGTVDCTYNILGGGGMGIGNAESHEDILRELLDYPLYPFFTWEVTPLLDWEDSLNQYVEYYKRIGSN